jgi:hypothetical protein
MPDATDRKSIDPPKKRAGWVFKTEDGKKEIGYAAPDEYLNAADAVRQFSRECVEHFGVWYRDSKGKLHSCADISTPEDFV